MANTAIVIILNSERKYVYTTNKYNLKINDYVVVETSLGNELGKVTLLKDSPEDESFGLLKPIIRLADDNDIIDYDNNLILQKEVIKKTKQLAIKNELDIKIFRAEYTLDRSKLMIYFESVDRVDFRNLVKDIHAIYNTRIELRQVGFRDSCKLLGGFGQCGLVLCCKNFIKDFDKITLKMAKKQNLSINSQKNSGVCGVLMCCLKYEDEQYDELIAELPQIGNEININGYSGVVVELNLISAKIKIKNQDGKTEWVHISELKPKEIV